MAFTKTVLQNNKTSPEHFHWDVQSYWISYKASLRNSSTATTLISTISLELEETKPVIRSVILIWKMKRYILSAVATRILNKCSLSRQIAACSRNIVYKSIMKFDIFILLPVSDLFREVWYSKCSSSDDLDLIFFLFKIKLKMANEFASIYSGDNDSFNIQAQKHRSNVFPKGSFTIYVYKLRWVGGWLNVNECKCRVGRWSDNCKRLQTFLKWSL